ncbi:hypothetical protein [Candidatus Poriferisocius sp.]|uniref:hypothetical protein n=1 Tax=Candidatus Poriferisocius sp. TaxID=3101276 RepID=UPI003B0183AA
MTAVEKPELAVNRGKDTVAGALRTESANPQRAARTRLRQVLEGHEQILLVERGH